jgi:uncharacterized protein YbjT (DUF2867 family)
MNKVKVIVTGASGMVGEGVLIECLNNSLIEEVLVVGRKSCGHSHPKLKEILHSNFFDLSTVESQLTNYNACFFCLGVSSVGMKEPEYKKLTYELTLNFAQTVSRLNAGMQFCYISGAGTDSSEKGRQMWARVKGKTENDLKKTGFKAVYNFRPGMLQATPGQKNVLSYYKKISWLLPVFRFLTPGFVSSLKELGNAMINSVFIGYEKDTLEVKDIKLQASRIEE